MASAEVLRKNAERFMREVFNEHDLDAARQLLADDFEDQTPPPGIEPTKEGFVKGMEMLFNTFPDLSAELHDMIVSGDRVAVRASIRGTQTGEMPMPDGSSVPPTGRGVDIEGIDIIHANDEGLAVRHWGIYDQPRMMQQLGLMPGAEG